MFALRTAQCLKVRSCVGHVVDMFCNSHEHQWLEISFLEPRAYFQTNISRLTEPCYVYYLLLPRELLTEEVWSIHHIWEQQLSLSPGQVSTAGRSDV